MRRLTFTQTAITFTSTTLCWEGKTIMAHPSPRGPRVAMPSSSTACLRVAAVIVKEQHHAAKQSTDHPAYLALNQPAYERQHSVSGKIALSRHPSC